MAEIGAKQPAPDIQNDQSHTQRGLINTEPSGPPFGSLQIILLEISKNTTHVYSNPDVSEADIKATKI